MSNRVDFHDVTLRECFKIRRYKLKLPGVGVGCGRRPVRVTGYLAQITLVL